MAQKATRREQASAELLERLEHKQLSDKIAHFKSLKTLCEQIRLNITNQNNREFMMQWLSELEKALAVEQEILRAIDRHRRNAEKIDKSSFLGEITTIDGKETGAIKTLKNMFAILGGVSVDNIGKKKKAELKKFLKSYKSVSEASLARTRELLERLD